MKIGMNSLRQSALWRGFQLFAVLGTVALATPTAAIAQSSSQSDGVNRAFLDSLYTFLEAQDEVAYQVAINHVGDASNVWLAQGICVDFNNGLSPADGYELMINAGLSQLQGLSGQAYEEASYSLALYGGSMMNLGAAYYCPQYQPAVEQALRSL